LYTAQLHSGLQGHNVCGSDSFQLPEESSVLSQSPVAAVWSNGLTSDRGDHCLEIMVEEAGIPMMTNLGESKA
jgi:hypothetical protein